MNALFNKGIPLYSNYFHRLTMTAVCLKDEIVQFKNCRLIRNHQIVDDYLWIQNGKIINPEPIFFDQKIGSHRQIDCNGAIIAPGFIDIQINGGFGIDFTNNTTNVEAGIEKVAKGLLAHGVTSFCPTLVTSLPKIYHDILPRFKKTNGGDSGANILGVHLEGPFIDRSKKGAHELECIRDFDNGISTVLETYGSLDNVAIITLAPEKQNALEVIEELTARNITVSVGHSTANLTNGEAAFKKGSKLITHLFNAMLPFHHRDPGLVGLLTSDQLPKSQTVYYGIIADGIHTHPAALRIAYRANRDGLILVTDAVSPLGLSDGEHRIGQLRVRIEKNMARIAGTETLCGSIASMDECVRTFKKSTGCSTIFAIEAATLHPAKCLNIENSKGTLDFGADADFIMLNDDLTVLSTWIAGKQVYSKTP
ncbi:N-acetylglucosamine-6-phosphate deacetylase [Contarinia nasturtii]|uniref:N-acetylglucosamine-6-phosphate deacetylase n=1 Tax=Contarinia nasturtii TaxID=265458 RepID=UPI0012D402A4|nr:N-acetylglucosamine-6-phosphate deacetylase [Contarinia nasturtii]